MAAGSQLCSASQQMLRNPGHEKILQNCLRTCNKHLMERSTHPGHPEAQLCPNSCSALSCGCPHAGQPEPVAARQGQPPTSALRLQGSAGGVGCAGSTLQIKIIHLPNREGPWGGSTHTHTPIPQAAWRWASPCCGIRECTQQGEFGSCCQGCCTLFLSCVSQGRVPMANWALCEQNSV